MDSLPRRSRVALLGFIAVSVSTTLAAAAVPATEALPVEQIDNVTVVYESSELLRFNPLTAEDMIRHIPGGARILDKTANSDSQRGFGSGGEQIRINGERLAAKSIDVTDVLRRIQASNVLRIEQLFGSTGAQSEGTVINVVLKSVEASRGSGSWEGRYLFNENGYGALGGLVSYGFSVGNIEYLLSFETENMATNAGGWAERDRQETYYFPEGGVMQDRPQDWIQHRAKNIYTGSMALDASERTHYAVNAFFETWEFNEDAVINTRRYDRDGQEIFNGIETSSKTIDRRLRYELTATLRQSFGTGGEWNALILHGYQDQPVLQQRWLCAWCTTQDGPTRELSRNQTDARSSETILRSTISWDLPDEQVIEIGAEFARNLLSQDFLVALDINGDGTVENIDFPTAHARVEELRFEPFVSYRWQRDSWSVESWLSGEQTAIKDNFAFSPEADYRFVKPRVDLRYQATPDDVIDFKIERTVSQLDLTEFVPGFDFQDARIEAGNPELRPEQTLVMEVGLEHRMADGQGNVSLRSFLHQISDQIDKVALTVADDGKLYSASGNIGDAEVYGGEVEASFDLRRINLQDAVVDVRYLRNFSSVRDPFSEENRSVPDTYDAEWEFRFRHDLPPLGLAYGLHYLNRQGQLPYSQIKYNALLSSGSMVDAYIEKRIGSKLSLFVSGFGLLSNQDYRSRTVYADNAIIGTVLRREHYVETRDRRVSIALRGSF